MPVMQIISRVRTSPHHHISNINFPSAIIEFNGQQQHQQQQKPGHLIKVKKKSVEGIEESKIGKREENGRKERKEFDQWTTIIGE